MTILELRQAHPDDAEFLALPEVRRAYWRAVGVTWQNPPLIPPLLEAVEELREKVADRPEAIECVCIAVLGHHCMTQDGILADPLTRLVIFLAVLEAA